MYLRRVLNGHLVYHTPYIAIEESLQREALLSIRPGRAPSGAAGNAQAGAMTMKGAKTDTEWFSPEELAAAREEYLQEQEKEQPSPQVKLRYAIALAKSRKRDDKYRAIGLLEDLLDQSYAPKESLYWIALTLCGLGEYRASRSYCERLLRMEPSHMKAQLLHKRIKEVVAREDGVVGVGIVGAVVVAGLALKFLLKR